MKLELTETEFFYLTGILEDVVNSNSVDDCYKEQAHIMYRKLTKKECAHESDGQCYMSYPSQLKCKKCGEFLK
jgi:hypothetical protein